MMSPACRPTRAAGLSRVTSLTSTPLDAGQAQTCRDIRGDGLHGHAKPRARWRRPFRRVDWGCSQPAGKDAEHDGPGPTVAAGVCPRLK